MCGRFSTPDAELVIKAFKLDPSSDKFEPIFNAAPSMNLPIVREVNGRLELARLRWGLIPSWAKDLSIGNKMINARIETIAEKPSFKKALQNRRCIVPAAGFYEWKIDGAKKQPIYIFPKDKSFFSLAGLWELWKSQDGEVIESFTVITTEANDLMSSIHDRMPVILKRETLNSWLSSKTHEPLKEVDQIESSTMDSYPVSTMVNNPRNNSADCVKPIEH